MRRIGPKFKQKFFATLKTAAGCADCGCRKAAKLQFHHAFGKRNFMLNAWTWNIKDWEAIITELEKCDVYCVSCHSKITNAGRACGRKGHKGRGKAQPILRESWFRAFFVVVCKIHGATFSRRPLICPYCEPNELPKFYAAARKIRRDDWNQATIDWVLENWPEYGI